MYRLFINTYSKDPIFKKKFQQSTATKGCLHFSRIEMIFFKQCVERVGVTPREPQRKTTTLEKLKLVENRDVGYLRV